MGSLRSLHSKERLEQVAPAKTTDEELLNAILEQDIKTVERLLALDADPGAIAENGFSTLTYAVCIPSLKIAKSLIAFGADVNQRSRDGWTSLMLEVFSGHSLFGTRFLLEHGADINAVNDQGATALMIAILNGQFAKAELLIDEGADVQLRDQFGRTALDFLEGVKGEAAKGLRQLLKERA